MRSAIQPAEPAKVTDVHGISKDPMHLRLHHPTTGSWMGEADRLGLRREGLERVLTTRVQVEERGEQRTAYGVDLDSMGGEVVHVSHGRFGRPVALLGLLAQSLFDLLAQ